jgi:ribosomal protein L37AE/L43A
MALSYGGGKNCVCAKLRRSANDIWKLEDCEAAVSDEQKWVDAEPMRKSLQD